VVLIIVLVILEFFAMFTKDIVHKAVFAATSTTLHQSVRSTDKTTVWQLTWAFVVVAAAVVEWDQALSEVPAARHCGCLFSVCLLFCTFVPR
jgi:hypothetical protein